MKLRLLSGFSFVAAASLFVVIPSGGRFNRAIILPKNN